MQEQGELKREEKPAAGGPAVVYCPICGEPMGPWGIGHHHHHVGPWGMRRWGMGPMAAMWGGGPWAMASCGILPAVLGFAIGYMVASARTSAWWAWKESKAHR